MVLNKLKPSADFAIEIEGKAVGGIGNVPNSDVERISAEIGYWLGEKYWNKGIMTDAVKEMAQRQLTRLNTMDAEKVFRKLGTKKTNT